MFTIAKIVEVIIKQLLEEQRNQKAEREADSWTYYACYALGYREPNYPVPTVYKERI